MSNQEIHMPKGAVSDQPHEFLVFTLQTEEYGIDIQKVQEIRGYDPVTRIANSAEYIKGIVNLRGVIVPIVDLRMKFNLGTPTYDAITVVIILNVNERVVGLVVDSVADVITLNAGQMRPAPAIGSTLSTDFMIGLGVVDERMLILVDIDRLLSSADFGLFEELAA